MASDGGRICAVDECGRRHKARGYCDKHFRRFLKHGDPLKTLGGGRRRLDEACSVDQCGGIAHARTYCRRHYIRWQRYGDPLAVSQWAQGNRETPAWIARRRKAGARLEGAAPGGYTYVCQPDSPMANSRGLVLEHRWVMAQHLRRDLLPAETVHHLNGIRTDNRLDNLELWVKAQPYGQRASDLVAFARRILEQYGDDF